MRVLDGSQVSFLEAGFHAQDVSICGMHTEVEFHRNRLDNTVFRSSAEAMGCPNPLLSTRVHDNVFQGGGVSLRSQGDLRGNTFRAGQVPLGGTSFAAVVIDAFPAVVSHNVFEANDIALVADHSGTSLIEANAFLSNHVGVYALGSEKPVLRGNSLVGNEEASLFNTDADRFDRSAPAGLMPLEARWNWWGSNAGPPLDGAHRLVGAAAYEPWLEQPAGETTRLLRTGDESSGQSLTPHPRPRLRPASAVGG